MNSLKVFIPCFAFLILTSFSFAQAQTQPIHLDVDLGDTLDLFERNYFEFYQELDGFIEATFQSVDENQVAAHIKCEEDQYQYDTTIYHSIAEFDEMKKTVNENRRKSYSRYDANIKLKSGREIESELYLYDLNYLYFYSDLSGITKKYRIPTSSIDTIFVGDISGGAVLIYPLLGVSIGAMIGLTTVDKQEWLGGMDVVANSCLFGVIIGAIFWGIGSNVSTEVPQDNLIIMNDRIDILQLKPFVKYNFNKSEQFAIEFIE